jgi:hypothetical protein
MLIICWIKDFMKWERSNGRTIKNANAFKNPDARAATSLLLFGWLVRGCKTHREESSTCEFKKMQGY